MSRLFWRGATSRQAIDTIMNHNVLSVSMDSTAKDAANKMLDNKINKILVTENNQPKRVLELFKIGPEDLRDNKQVKDLPLSGLGEVSSGTSVEEAYPILRDYSAVVVKDRHTQDVSGVVTLTDYMRHIT
jgi:predicted transcriptional regulator